MPSTLEEACSQIDVLGSAAKTLEAELAVAKAELYQAFTPKSALSRAELCSQNLATPHRQICTGPRTGSTTTYLKTAIGREGVAQVQEWSEARRFPGRDINERELALSTVRDWSRPDTIWTDGSRQGSGRVGAARV